MGPGSVISNKYRLVRCLGEGGMGAVWEALNLRTQRSFALKLVRGDEHILPELRVRMLKEASVAGRLEHPNVIEVYDVGETESGDPYLVMELLRGETLAELLDRRGSFDTTRAAAVGAEVAAALAAAHAAGVVHRDLKPANVFLHEDPARGRVVKVLDFGVSKLIDPASPSATVTGAPIGTPAYMSPEQARGSRDVDARTDVWALGVMLFEMVAGRLPFGGATAFEVVGEVLHARIPRLGDWVTDADPRFDDIVARCLEREPKKRFGSARELGAELESLLPKRASALVTDFDEDATLSRKVAARGPPPGAVSDSATTELTPPVPTGKRKWPAPALAAGGVALLFVVGLVLGQLYVRSGPAAEVVSASPPAPSLAMTAEPSASAAPPSLVPSAAATASEKKPPRRVAPCPKEKLLIDPVTGKPTCVRR